ncbi:uncharacterized protein ACDP82_017626 [Pangshura tecta]
MDKMYARKWEGEKKQLKTPTEAPTCNIAYFARSLREIQSAFFEASSLGQLWRKRFLVSWETKAAFSELRPKLWACILQPERHNCYTSRSLRSQQRGGVYFY